MDELEKWILGKWIEIKDKARDIYAINDYFKLSTQTLKLEIERLTSSVELGVIEYKRHISNAIFRQLGNIQYKSLNLDMIRKLANLTKMLLYIILLQRLIAAGIIKIEKDKTDDKISADNIEITLILKDILARIKENPEITKKAAVKNILLQFTIYKNEKETLKKLSSNNKEKTNSFYQNFKNVFEKIFASIRKNYAEILKEDSTRFAKSNVLVNIRDKKLVSIIFNQVKEVSRILATLEFAHYEKYKTREILVNLFNSKNIIFEYIEQELNYYRDYSKTNAEKEKIITVICNNFSREIVNLLTKQIQ